MFTWKILGNKVLQRLVTCCFIQFQLYIFLIFQADLQWYHNLLTESGTQWIFPKILLLVSITPIREMIPRPKSTSYAST